MKIDIHTHTRKCKSGDAPTREISASDFCRIVQSTDVGIIAITNHNVFDLPQFNDIVTTMNGAVQTWPGVELDILDGGSRGHLIVIVSPQLATQFSAAVDKLTANSNADQFTAKIEDVVIAFEDLKPLYVAHYKQKKPAISDDVIQLLLTKTQRPECVIKEVTNSISAGIYISHGYASIYGSDIHDWSKYIEKSGELPDLRLPVESFEHFCLLLTKDPTAINTVLNKKTAEELELRPFGDSTVIKLQAYNDINVLFGPKGTGKTCILEAISKYYSGVGIETKVYMSKIDRLEDLFDIKGKNLTIDLNPYGIHYCTSEIETVRKAAESSVTSIERYVNYFAVTSSNTIAKRILLKDIEPEQESGPVRKFRETATAASKTRDFLQFFLADLAISEQLDSKEFTALESALRDLLKRLEDASWLTFSEWHEVRMLNSAIARFRSEIERKTGKPAKPTSTGFRDYAMNRMKIERDARTILANLALPIPTESQPVGSLGPEKGELDFITSFHFQDGQFTDGAYSPVQKSAKKAAQKKFATCVRRIAAHAYEDDLFKDVAELNDIDDGEEIKTVLELLLFNRYFALNGQRYVPSSGEASMVMLQQELGVDRDVYVLDEPERSLGNEYISDVIVPLIKERARAGKKVFISTHDANIAVRTLPYNSIYRCHQKSGYRTYVGNPFSNYLTATDGSGERLDWKKVSMKTLEGGEQAFGERGKIYGNR